MGFRFEPELHGTLVSCRLASALENPLGQPPQVLGRTTDAEHDFGRGENCVFEAGRQRLSLESCRKDPCPGTEPDHG